MAFGFAQTVAGVIAAGDTEGPAGRFRVDFARAYVDHLTIVPHGGSPPAEESTLVFGDTLAPGAIPACRVPSFPGEALRHAHEPGVSRHGQAPARVCLFGPESTGKSTLADALAAHYRCPLAHEYARSWLDAIGSTGTREDLPWIARGQRATEAAAALQAERLLVCDTNLATIALWSDVLYGDTPGWIHAAAATDRYDLWLLTGIDVPYAPDPQRCFPDPEQRTWFMAACRRTLERMGIVPVVISGDPATRLAAASAAIDSLLAHRTEPVHPGSCEQREAK